VTDIDTLTREDLDRIRDRLMAGHKEARIPGSGYVCCANGPCQQHQQQYVADRAFWWAGRSKADRDES
jgi:hypothetical protein